MGKDSRIRPFMERFPASLVVEHWALHHPKLNNVLAKDCLSAAELERCLKPRQWSAYLNLKTGTEIDSREGS